MPLLKYKCTSCNELFEDFVRLDDIDSVACPACGKLAVRAYEGVYNALKNRESEPYHCGMTQCEMTSSHCCNGHCHCHK